MKTEGHFCSDPLLVGLSPPSLPPLPPFPAFASSTARTMCLKYDNARTRDIRTANSPGGESWINRREMGRDNEDVSAGNGDDPKHAEKSREGADSSRDESRRNEEATRGRSSMLLNGIASQESIGTKDEKTLFYVIRRIRDILNRIFSDTTCRFSSRFVDAP